MRQPLFLFLIIQGGIAELLYLIDDESIKNVIQKCLTFESHIIFKL